MIEVDCVQVTPEWWMARRGMPTASDFSKIMTPTKWKTSASQEPYIAQLIADITCLSPNYFSQQGGPVNASVEYGRATEAKARRYYEHTQGVTVRQVGFCKTDDGRFGCSPDGLVDPDGGLELKCPNRDTHLLYLMKGVVPTEYMCQVHGCMIVTGRRWWDFMSYAEGLDPLIIRVVPDDFTMALRVQLELFWKKFAAAKAQYIHPEGQDVDTPEVIAEAKKWTDFLAGLEGEVFDKKITEQQAVEAVNYELPKLKGYEMPAKRKVYGVLKAWIEARPVKWHLDNVNLIYRLEESIEF